MSGLHCHKIRAYDNGAPLASDMPTWAHMLCSRGYRVPLYGKMHFLGPDQLHGFDEHKHEPRCEIDGCRWGEEAGCGKGYPAFGDIHFTDDANLSPKKVGNYHNDLGSLASGIEFLRAAPEQTRPFCLTVGFHFPHYPMVVDRRIYDSYRDAPIPPPRTQGWLHPRNENLGNQVWGFDRLTPAQVRDSRRAYLAMITMTDEWIGQLIDTLRDTGQLDNTLVIYTSDHGDLWGEHGMWGKNQFYEDSSRVPLIVRGPGQGVAAGRRIATPVSLLDLYPTLRDISGATDWNVPLDGRSLWPALTGGATLDDVPVFCDYYSSDVKGPERMVRWKQYKLNYYHNWGMELFDLEKDPFETTNRASDRDYQEILGKLLTMGMRDWNPQQIDADVRVEQNRRVLLSQSLRTSRRLASEVSKSHASS
jgi:choline-sulfatase